MNIQIFGKSKCFETKKAERYFKERSVKFHSIDLLQSKGKPSAKGKAPARGLSKGELTSVINAIGLESLVNEKAKDYHLYSYLTDDAKPEKLLECPALLKTPIVRNGKQATIGYCPDVWKEWS